MFTISLEYVQWSPDNSHRKSSLKRDNDNDRVKNCLDNSHARLICTKFLRIYLYAQIYLPRKNFYELTEHVNYPSSFNCDFLARLVMSQCNHVLSPSMSLSTTLPVYSCPMVP